MGDLTPENPEIARIRHEYARREREIPKDFYALDRPANLFIRHGQERALLRGLRDAGLVPLAGRKVLEVGCGSGQWFASFEELGARRMDLAGIELDGARVAECRERYPGADVREGDAAALPWSDGRFDVVFQSTVFTSILDDGLKRRVAAEMMRVCRRDGAIVWYDFRFNNPRNAAVRGIRAAEIRRLFPGWRLQARQVTLAPPLARRLVPISWTTAAVLEALGVLNTHLLAVLTPEGRTR